MPLPRTVPIRRVLTDTPLARQHERFVSGKSTRRIARIPWSAWRRERYPAPALDLARQAQQALAFGEYGAIDLFSRMLSAMALNAVPFDLLTAASRIPGDEARHAEYALHMASLCAGEAVAFPFDRRAMPAPKKAIQIEDLDGFVVETAAIGETLAAALIDACRRQAEDPVVKALFTSIAGDEVHHARVGWYYLSWRSPQWTLAERQRMADRAGALLVNAEPTFWKGRDAPAGSRKAAKALGVLDSKTQRRVVRCVMEDEIVPALDALGLGASHAWKRRRRGEA